MRSNTVIPFVKGIAAFIDLSFVLQMLLVPFAFALSIRQVQAAELSTETNTPKVNLEYRVDSNEFALEVNNVEEVEYTLTYQTAQGIQDGFFDGGAANDSNTYTSVHRAGTESSGHSVDFTVQNGDIKLTATSATGEDFSYNRDFTVENGFLVIQEGRVESQESGYWPTVELGTTYISPDNNLVQLTFTKLPETPGDLRISQISLTAEQMTQAGTTVPVAYEITSSMENGTFEYTLTLPNPLNKADVTVQFSEDGQNFEEVGNDADLQVTTQDDQPIVTLSGLDHFTIFVVVPDDIIPGNIIAAAIEGWRMTQTGNATIGLVDSVIAGVGNTFGPHVIKTSRPGTGTTSNRSFLGFFPGYGTTLNALEEVSWNRYTKIGDDTYLNIYITNAPLGVGVLGDTASVVFKPSITMNTWDTEIFNSGSTGIQVRVNGGTPQNITFDQLMADYGNWYIYNDTACTSTGSILGFEFCLQNRTIGGIVLVSGSSSPTAQQEHYFDGVTIKFVGQEGQYFNFVDETPVAPAAPTLLTPANPTFYKTSQLPKTQTWTSVPNVVKYIYESCRSNPADNGGECPAGDVEYTEERTVPNRTIGNTAAEGKYWWHVKAVNSDGVEGAWSEAWVFGVDNTPPTVSNITITPTINSNIGRTVIVQFDLNDLSGIDLTKTRVLFADGPDQPNRAKESAKFSPVLVAGNTYKVQIDTTSFLSQNYIGNYNLAFNLYDVLGNQKSQKPAEFRPVLIDNSGPTASLVSPLSGSLVNGTQRFTFSITDDTGVASAYTKFNGPTSKQLNLVHDTGNQWYVDVDTTSITDGTYTIDVRPIDVFGTARYNASRGTVIIDKTAPAAPTLTWPVNNSFVNASLPIPNDWEDVSDAASYTYRSYNVNGAGVCNLSDIRFTGSYTDSETNTRTIANNLSFCWQVKAVDLAGNESNWSDLWKVTIDNEVPETTLTSPSGGDISSGPITIIGETTDNWNVEKVTLEYSVAGADTWNFIADVDNPLDDTPFSFSYDWTPPTEGAYDIRAYGTDLAGNQEQTAIVSGVIYDTTLPTVTITSPGASSVFSNSGLIDVLGKITDNVKLKWYTFVIENQGGSAVAGPGTVEITSTTDDLDLTFPWDTNAMPNGQYTILLSAIDAAGNATASTQTIVTVNNPTDSGKSSDGGSGSSSKSSSPKVCTTATPGSLTGLTIVTTANGATLNWTRPGGALTHYGLEFVRLDANGNEVARHGVSSFGNSDTTSFTVSSLLGGYAYRFELFAVNDCAPGPRAFATSGTITGTGTDFGLGGVVITPNAGEEVVLGASTDEELIENAENEEDSGEVGGGLMKSILDDVLGVSTENGSTTSFWWILAPLFALFLLIIFFLLKKKKKASDTVQISPNKKSK